MQELRLAVRRLTRRPASTLASIATLACAIAAAAVTWSTVSAILIHPLPVADGGRLMVVGTVDMEARERGAVRTAFLYPAFHRIRDSGAFQQVAAQWASGETLLVGRGERPVSTPVGFATYEFFDVLGLAAVLGRGFSRADDLRGAAPVALLTEGYWRRRMNADTSVIGRTLAVADKTVTIVGVLPKGFRGLDLSRPVDLYLPFHTIADFGSPTINYFADTGHKSSPTSGTMIIGRLRPGDSVGAVTARLAAGVLRQGSREVPRLTDANTAAVPSAARHGMVAFSRLLSVTVALLVLIGCCSVGMLLLIRTEARTEEFAMCMALGASRRGLVKGIMAEGMLLAAAGAVMAIPMASWLFGLLRAFRLPGGVDIETLDLSVDAAAVSAVSVAAAFAVLLITILAAGFGFRGDVAEALRSRAGATARVSRRRTRSALVVVQVAVALALLAGAGLFARSLSAALSLNPGSDMHRIVSGEVALSAYGYTAARANQFFEDLETILERNPAIAAVTIRSYHGGMSPRGKVIVDGAPRQFPTTVSYLGVDEDYFHTMRLPLRAGRTFTSEDRPGAPLVAIVSESYAKLLGDGASPVGRRITMGWNRAGEPPDEIIVVGVVADLVTNVTVLEPLLTYLPAQQTDSTIRRDVIVRANDRADDARREIMSAIRQVDSRVMSGPLLSLEERIAQQMGPQRFGAAVLGALGAIAVLLTVLATYVLADSLTTLRLREMGIRAALGATRSQLASIVLAEATRLIGIGILAGLGIAWIGATTIRAFLFQVQPLDPLTLVSASVMLLLLALAVSLRAAMRAARVDLSTVLKAE